MADGKLRSQAAEAVTPATSHDDFSCARRGPREIKCLVWDLDNTLWDGVLLEGNNVQLKCEAPEIVRTLDGRGILQSLASRSDYKQAMAKLKDFSLDEYFLFPQISWSLKSVSIRTIAERLNIATDVVAFIDDDPYERAEVGASLPDVLTIDAVEVRNLLAMPEMNPRFITEDSRKRRSMYQAEIERRKLELVMPPADFLTSLKMIFTISEAGEDDLNRIEELTVRTNQLNSTGYTYSYEELRSICHSPRHKLFIAGLDDRYGTYGKVGVALVQCDGDVWRLKLLLMSCRVLSRGVGSILLNHVLHAAAAAGARVLAEFVRTERNRMMYLTFKLAGFQETDRQGSLAVLEHDLHSITDSPTYAEVVVST